MASRFEYWIGKRYLRSRSGNSFVSLISAISMLGIAIAVAVLIVVLSVVNGFERELEERLLAMISHATIESASDSLPDWEEVASIAANNPRVTAAAPFVTGQALLVSGEDLSGAELRGIDPVPERDVSNVAEVMLDGELTSLEAGKFNIVLGVELADKLGVVAGDKVTVTLAQGLVTPAGVMPRTKRFTVSGIYRVGMFEFDRRLAFINITDAQRLYRLGDEVSGVRLAVSDIAAAREIVNDAGSDVVSQSSLSNNAKQMLRITDWRGQHGNLFRSIEITKSILFVILLLVIAVAAFNIVSTLVMVVKDKQGDIAILRTIGASPGSIVKVFVTQGSLIGLTGTLFGVFAGVLLALNLETVVAFFESVFNIKFLAADVYFISDLPSELRKEDVGLIAAIALVLALISTFYPAWMAARTAPAEALRYE